MDIWKPSEELVNKLAAKSRFSLADLKAEAPSLGPDQIAFAIFTFAADKLTKTGQCDEHVTVYFLAQQIIRYYLGDEWVEANIYDAHSTEQRHKDGRAFLRSDSANKDDRFRHQHRVIELAECLYNLQSVLGIDQRFALLERDSLESAFAELQCARIMAAPECKFRFVTPQGIKQCDYDAELTTPAGRVLCCEIKSKEEGIELSERTVKNTLEHARKQLPKNGPSIVWITIPESWSTQPGAKAVVDAAIKKALPQMGRLVAVLVAFEVWEPAGTGMLMQFRFTAALNLKGRFYQEDVEEGIRNFGSDRRPGWITVDQMVGAILPESVDFIRAKIANEA